jgi:mannose-6-phosphate isomerase
MIGIRRLINPVQEYAWGSTTAIPGLLGLANPEGRPQAELWMGAHPRGPSLVEMEGRRISLAELIASDPEAVLGSETAARFGAGLPFLFKVLAAAEPLSIQAHPNKEQARDGFSRENEEGIPLDAFQRSYRDAFHKPEILCALTPFWALKGFRPAAEILDLCAGLGPVGLEGELELLRTSGDAGLKPFFAALMSLPAGRRERACAEAAARCKEPSLRADPSARAEWTWIARLHDLYPEDSGILSPLYLNLVRLAPGEAVFLPAGELHAYLEGTGIELMANSDNVLRGGLTPKHVDVPELLRILRFAPASAARQERRPGGPGETVYLSPAREFRLSRLTLPPPGGAGYQTGGPRSAEILLCTRGKAFIRAQGATDGLLIRQGESVLIAADLPDYTLRGEADFYKAAVPL